MIYSFLWMVYLLWFVGYVKFELFCETVYFKNHTENPKKYHRALTVGKATRARTITRTCIRSLKCWLAESILNRAIEYRILTRARNSDLLTSFLLHLCGYVQQFTRRLRLASFIAMLDKKLQQFNFLLRPHLFRSGRRCSTSRRSRKHPGRRRSSGGSTNTNIRRIFNTGITSSSACSINRYCRQSDGKCWVVLIIVAGTERIFDIVRVHFSFITMLRRRYFLWDRSKKYNSQRQKLWEKISSPPGHFYCRRKYRQYNCLWQWLQTRECFSLSRFFEVEQPFYKMYFVFHPTRNCSAY